MLALQYELKNTPPIPSRFAELREIVGWPNPDLETLCSSIQKSLFWVTSTFEERLIATGRVVGDGEMYFYIQDVIVHPEYQGAGLGTAVMQAIEGYLRNNCRKGATIGLFAAQGKEAFYKKFEFLERNGKNLGLGMCRFV